MGDPSIKWEGVLGGPVADVENVNAHARSFLPYNPTIVEIGAYEGAGTMGLAQAHPYARIVACEPNPRAFAVLAERARAFPHVVPANVAIGTSNGVATLHVGAGDDERSASLLPPIRHDERSAPATVEVPVMVLDDWCAGQGIERVHFLRVDAGGFELQILMRSPRILATAVVVVAKTYFYKPSPSVISSRTLRLFLEMSGFEMAAHVYRDGDRGEATFVRRIVYDSVFR